MIVDDEPLFREYLIHFIPWEDYGFSIVAEAKNGEEALVLADEHQPDIVLSDINMPKMDGLEFARQLLIAAPQTSIIFITGHNEFEFARQAIRLGANDYILKPFEKEELILTLLKLKDNIHETDKLALGQSFEDSSYMLPLLTSMFHNPNPSLQKRLADYGFYQPDADFLLICLDIDHIDYNYSDAEEKVLWRFSVMNILKELLGDCENLNKNDYHMFYDYEGNITGILDSRYTDSFFNVFQHLIDAVNKYLDFNITIGVSTSRKGTASIPLSYNEALSALHYKYIQKNSPIIFYNDISDSSKDFSLLNASFNEELLSHLRSRDKEKIHESLDQLYKSIASNQISYDFSRIIQMGIISLLISYITQAGKSLSIVFKANDAPFHSFDKADTLELQKALVTDFFDTTIDYFSENQQSRTALIASQGKQFIDDHYANSSLTVQDIASSQFINQTYLRSMFKKEYGITVSDYLTKVRMESAAALIKEKTHRLADIAEMVGYNDSSYFSKCFKKHFGLSPSQFELNA
jgi:two-component system response regulator YesN